MIKRTFLGKTQLVCQALITLLLFLPALVHSQTNCQVNVSPSASLYAHPNSNLNIFSDISHAGTLVSYNTARINFYGTNWLNESNSRLPDESPSGIDGTGGIFRFSDLLQTPQQIISINSLPFNGFPNIMLDNEMNVTVSTGNLHVNNNLDFSNGHMILANVDVNVGKPGTGTITNYSHTKFIVTGTDMTGGSLVRNVTGSPSSIDFPIGTGTGSYTPVSISYTGRPQTISFRVAENVYNKLNFPEYVDRTWSMTTSSEDPSAKADITIQHNSAEEGIEYFRNRSEGYITRYDSKLTGLWDILPPMATGSPGLITTGAAIINAYMNTRLNLSAIGPIENFSKSVIKEDIDESTPVNIPDAISPNGDGFNDTYIIEKRRRTDIIRFEIYSRNQVLVFKDTNYQNTFDGTGNAGGFLGNTIPDGIYYYLISVNGAKGIPGYLIINR